MDYLNQKHPPLYSIIKTVDFININRYIERDLTRVVSYYHNRERRVESTHLIASVIKNLYPVLNVDIFDYMKQIDRVLHGTVKHFHLSAPYSKGSILDKSIIPGTSTWLNVIETKDNYFFIDDWKNEAPIRPMLTDTTDLFYPHPDHMDSVYGTIIYDIDVKLLAVMYYHWARERIAVDGDTDPSVFVYQYVLTNMIPYYTGHAVANILFSGEIDMTIKPKHTFVVSDMRKKLLSASRKQRKKLKTKRPEYVTLLHSIEIPYLGNAYELYRTHTRLLTSNNITPSIISRAYLYINLFTFYKKDAMRANASFARTVSEKVGRIRNMNNRLPEDIDILQEMLVDLLDAYEE
jgi:hypothetical protein